MVEALMLVGLHQGFLTGGLQNNFKKANKNVTFIFLIG